MKPWRFERDVLSEAMEPTRELTDEIWREKIRRAKAMTPEERFAEGLRLSDFVFDMMRAGIRDRFPDVSEDQVDRILCQQLERVRRIEERGIYTPIDDPEWDAGKEDKVEEPAP
jgi:hypothetical protein